MNLNSEFPWNTSRGTDPGLIALKLKGQLEELLCDIDRGREDYQSLLIPRLQKHLEKGNPFSVNKQSLYKWVVNDCGPMWRRSMEVFQQLDAAGIDVCLNALYDLWAVPGEEASRKRVAAVEVLGSMGRLAPIEPLILASADPFWDVRAAAAQALGNMGEYTPVDFLTSLLEWELDESVGETIIRVLGQQGKRMPVGKLVKILRYHKSWMLRQAAAWALGELGANAPLKWLRYTLEHDEDECVRIAAVRSLGQTGKQQAKKALYEALLDPDEEVRGEAKRVIDHLDRTFSSWEGYKATPMFDFSLDSTSEDSDDEIFADSVPEPSTDPERFDILEEEIFYLFTENERYPPLSKTSPIWGESVQEQLIGLLTDFLKDKKGYMDQPTVLQTAKGPVLLLTCFYQHSRTLQDVTLPSIQAIATLRSIDAALRDSDEAVTQTVEQTFENLEERAWIDWLIVSLELSRQPKWGKGEYAPLRVIISGMSCQDIQNDKPPILNQMVSTWISTLKEPTVCQRPNDLTNVKIWYQRTSDYFIEREERVK